MIFDLHIVCTSNVYYNYSVEQWKEQNWRGIKNEWVMMQSEREGDEERQTNSVSVKDSKRNKRVQFIQECGSFSYKRWHTTFKKKLLDSQAYWIGFDSWSL